MNPDDLYPLIAAGLTLFVGLAATKAIVIPMIAGLFTRRK